jgi:hypothetical protein
MDIKALRYAMLEDITTRKVKTSMGELWEMALPEHNENKPPYNYLYRKGKNFDNLWIRVKDTRSGEYVRRYL